MNRNFIRDEILYELCLLNGGKRKIGITNWMNILIVEETEMKRKYSIEFSTGYKCLVTKEYSISGKNLNSSKDDIIYPPRVNINFYVEVETPKGKNEDDFYNFLTKNFDNIFI
ncbi:hypothetical protein BPT24_164 [Tenacibaculum phage pT24]|uniref:Uncharacterized protein n=1 Tax=Tenacibaculum phage pT24 TaxID=1880590 RepID=A0A1B4XWV4_9CAUD|nr:hypothetical protein HYP10_gp164 [Tenacibaculum phage pT24]BAV39290.1 hypothetical protein BPT24_164 [Tenacibaculum phage pT24]